jgi:hypothetical protein
VRARHENLDKDLVLAKEQLRAIAGSDLDDAAARIRDARQALRTAQGKAEYSAAIAALRQAQADLGRAAQPLPATAHANAYWPYAGRGALSGGGRSTPTTGQSLVEGEPRALTRYRRGAAHLQRAVVALVACAGGIRWRLEPLRTDPAKDKPANVPSGPASATPTSCSRRAAWILQELPLLEAALDEPDVPDVVLDQLLDLCREVDRAHFEFSRAAPATSTGGRAYEQRPTKPARKRGR